MTRLVRHMLQIGLFGLKLRRGRANTGHKMDDHVASSQLDEGKVQSKQTTKTTTKVDLDVCGLINRLQKWKI